jgi:hypothetical protein
MVGASSFYFGWKKRGTTTKKTEVNHGLQIVPERTGFSREKTADSEMQDCLAQFSLVVRILFAELHNVEHGRVGTDINLVLERDPVIVIQHGTI